MQKKLREVDRLSFVPKEMQECIKESLQHQLQDVEKRRNDPMPEHQKVQKRSKRYKAPRTKEEHCKKKSTAQKRKCVTSERTLIGKNNASLCCRTKSIKKWQMRKWKQNFRECKLEKKEEVAMHRKWLIAAWRRWWNRFSLWERTRRGLSSMPCVKYSSRDSRPSPLPRRRQEKKKEEETLKMNKSKAEPVSSWCYQRQAGSIKEHR